MVKICFFVAICFSMSCAIPVPGKQISTWDKKQEQQQSKTTSLKEEAGGSWERFENIQQCQYGDCHACYLVARGFETGNDNGNIDYEKAREYHRKGCDGGHDVACNSHEIYVMRETLENECKEGNPQSCVEFGKMLNNGQGGESNAELERQVYQQACEANNLDGCYHFATMLLRGFGGENEIQSAEFYMEKLCSAGHQKCSELKDIIVSVKEKDEQKEAEVESGYKFERAQKEKDPIEQRKLWGEICHNPGAWFDVSAACTNLGVMWLKGEGGEKSIDKALKYFIGGCRLGDKYGCELMLKLQQELGLY